MLEYLILQNRQTTKQRFHALLTPYDTKFESFENIPEYRGSIFPVSFNTGMNFNIGA